MRRVQNVDDRLSTVDSVLVWMNIRCAREGVKVPAHGSDDTRATTEGEAQVVSIDELRWRGVPR
jgi:hypothetical protein